MPSYYPSQGSHYSHRNRAGYVTSSNGIYQDAYPDAYHQPQNSGVHVVPTQSSSQWVHSYPTQVVPSTVPTVVVSQDNGARRTRSSSRRHRNLTFGDRFRRFFGLAAGGIEYRSKNSSWGFMGRSKRPRYYDARTGAEVDERGRRVYQV